MILVRRFWPFIPRQLCAKLDCVRVNSNTRWKRGRGMGEGHVFEAWAFIVWLVCYEWKL